MTKPGTLYQHLQAGIGRRPIWMLIGTDRLMSVEREVYIANYKHLFLFGNGRIFEVYTREKKIEEDPIWNKYLEKVTEQ
jgi:hypothetical protein